MEKDLLLPGKIHPKCTTTPCSFDHILFRLGELGRYQIYVYVWHVFNYMAFGPIQTFMVFGGNSPRLICANETKAMSMYQNSSFKNCELQGPFYSAVWEFGLYGDRAALGALMTVLQYAGGLLGLLAGTISDRFGRKPTYLVSCGALFAVTLISAFSPNWQTFAATRFFIGVFHTATYITEMVLVSEVFSTKWRSIIFLFGWPFGYVWLGILAKFTGAWRVLTISICAAFPLVLVMTAGIYESPKWLMQSNHIDKARCILQDIGKRNGLTESSSEHLVNELVPLILHEKRPIVRPETLSYIKSYLKDGRAKLQCFVILYANFADNVISYVIVLNLGNLSGDLALNFIYAMLARLIASLFVPVFDHHVPKFGRRVMYQSGLVGFSCCVILMLVARLTTLGTEKPEVLTGASIVALGFVSIIWIGLDLINIEAFPTELRSIGNSACVLVARVGCMVAPVVLLLNSVSEAATYGLILALLVVNHVTAGIFLPETKYKPLPDLSTPFVPTYGTPEVKTGSH